MIKSLVVDFDDTLSFATNRDWDNALPNLPLIEQLNLLYNKGCTIHIVTARGQLSCHGDIELADKKNRQQIETWLNRYGVLYTDLSFQKKYADYYIDDKAIKPEQFIEMMQRNEQ